MKKSRGSTIALFLFILSVVTYAQTPVSRHGQLRVDGNQIVNKNNQPAQLRGVSLYWSMAPAGAPYYNTATVNKLVSDFRINVIRAAMGVKESWGRGYIDEPNANRSRVEAVVDAAIANGIYVIIDWHSHNANNEERQAIEFFTAMAQKYGNRPNIIYEIFNEPKNQNWSSVIKPYSEKVIDAIRKHDRNNIIIVGTPFYSQRVDEATNDPIRNRSNLAYSLHFYAATNAHQQALRNRANTAYNRGYALFVTEFGTTEADGGGSVNTRETDIWLDWLDQRMISWVNWSVTHLNESSAIFRNNVSSGNWSNSDLTSSGTYIRNKLRGYNDGGNIYRVISTIRPNNSAGTVHTKPDAAGFSPGSRIEITAVPSAGYSFSHWTGGVTGTSATRTVTMNSNLNVTAHFNQEDYTLNLTADGQGTVTRNPNRQSYPSGTSVTITANPASGWNFSSWSGDITGSNRQMTIVMDGNKSATATFRPPFHPVTWEVEGEGEINRSPRATAYPQGSSITVTAVPDEGWYFVHWSGDLSGGHNPQVLQVDRPKRVTAVFREGEGDNRAMVFSPAAQRSDWAFTISNDEAILNSPATGFAGIAIYDMRGRLVHNLHNGFIRSGRQNIGSLRLPVGSYVMVVRDGLGAELFRDRFAFVN